MGERQQAADHHQSRPPLVCAGWTFYPEYDSLGYKPAVHTCTCAGAGGGYGSGALRAETVGNDGLPAEREFARRWRDMPTVVFSSTTSTVDGNSRLVTGDAVTEIARLKAEDSWVYPTLVETRTFPDGVVLTRYETRR